MLLMKENKEVASFDLYKNKPSNINKIFLKEDLPFALQNEKADINIMRWHSTRAIPNGRINAEKITNTLGDLRDLSLNSLGLSLTDHYWYKKEDSNLNWEDINFFDNEFSPDLFLLRSGLLKEQGLSPDYTTAGVLDKFWIISDNTPYLIKTGGFNNGDIILAANEVVAFRIASELNIPATSYQKFDYDNEIFCASKLFIDNKNEEFVSLRHIEMNLDAGSNSNLVRNYVKELGFSEYLDKLAIFNILIHNHDCHFDNAGLIKDTNTNEFIKPCKLFDNGTSLNWNGIGLGASNMKPFEASLEDYAKTIETTIDLPDIEKFKYIIDDVYNEFGISDKQNEIAKAELKNSYNIIKERFLELKGPSIQTQNNKEKLYLYHATDAKNVEGILKDGLLMNPPKHLWDKETCEGKIFLAFNPEDAYIYTETALEDIYENDNDINIAMFKIPLDSLIEIPNHYFECDYNVSPPDTNKISEICQYINSCVFVSEELECIPADMLILCDYPDNEIDNPAFDLNDFKDTEVFFDLLNDLIEFGYGFEDIDEYDTSLHNEDIEIE